MLHVHDIDHLLINHYSCCKLIPSDVFLDKRKKKKFDFDHFFNNRNHQKLWELVLIEDIMVSVGLFW